MLERIKTFLREYWFSILILPLVLYWLLNRGSYGLIDNADLVIHEAGHVLFMFFGKFIHALGGTLMQILLPSLIIFYFLKNRYTIGVQAGLLWLGQNLINISVYAADARAHKLHLLGGNKVYHDWTYLLSQTGLLEMDAEAGMFFFILAILTFLLLLIIPAFIK